MDQNLINVGVGYGDVGRPVQVYESFREWANTRTGDMENPGGVDVREAGSTSDFAYYMNAIVHRVFNERIPRAQSEWRKYVGTMSVSDFREVDSVMLSGLPVPQRVLEGGEYKDTRMTEIQGPKIRVHKYGNVFSLTREVFINDALNRIREIPQEQADAANLGLTLNIIKALENPGNAYDGVAFFHSTHGNLGSAALSEVTLATAVSAMRSQTNEMGQPLSIRPKYLVVPPELEFTAKRIVNSTEVHIPGTGSTAAYGQGNYNAVRGIVEVIVEDYLTDSNDWYLFADPNQYRPGFRVAFLQGRESPSLFLKDPGMRGVLATNPDPYTMEYDEIWWKVRFEYGVAPWEFRSVYKAVVT